VSGGGGGGGKVVGVRGDGDFGCEIIFAIVLHKI
jgi:hypothetical protein